MEQAPLPYQQKKSLTILQFCAATLIAHLKVGWADMRAVYCSGYALRFFYGIDSIASQFESSALRNE